jgi:hypothetical protein
MKNIIYSDITTTTSSIQTEVLPGQGTNLSTDFNLTVTNPTSNQVQIIVSSGDEIVFDELIPASGGIAEPYIFEAPSTNNSISYTNPSGIAGVKLNFELKVHD